MKTLGSQEAGTLEREDLGTPLMDVERLQQEVEVKRQEQDLRRRPWICCRCGAVLQYCTIVGIADDGTQQTFCGDCGERAYQATLPQTQRIERQRKTTLLTNRQPTLF